MAKSKKPTAFLDYINSPPPKERKPGDHEKAVERIKEKGRKPKSYREIKKKISF